MNAYRIVEPRTSKFVAAALKGTWQRENDCAECGSSARVRPLVIEWLRNTGEIGDFVWPGFSNDVAVAASAAEKLALAGLSGVSLGSVEILKSKKTSVHLAEAALKDLWVEQYENAPDTLLKLDRICGSCSRRIYSLSREMPSWIATLPTSYDVFRFVQLPGVIACSERFRNFVEDRGFTNIGFVDLPIVLSLRNT